MVTFEQLWCEKYAALAEAAEAEAAARRAEDFIEVSRTVCGLELRQVTPRDLLLLDYAGSPFIRGGDIAPASIAQFLWQMLERQPQGWLSRRRFFRHCAALGYDDSVAQIKAYIDRHFADAPKGGGGAPGQPIGTSFVAPLIVRIAAGIPSLTPPAIMDTPVSQLFQYQKILAIEEARKSGGKFREHTTVDCLAQECLAECNRLNAGAAASVSQISDPTPGAPSFSQISNPEISNPAPEAAAP